MTTALDEFEVIKIKPRNWHTIRVRCKGTTPLLLDGVVASLEAMVEGRNPPTYAAMRTDLDVQITDLAAEIKALKQSIGKPEKDMSADERAPIVGARKELRRLKAEKAKPLCEGKLYRNHRDELVLPTRMILACLRDAGGSFKIDRFHSISNPTGTLLHAILRIRDPQVVLEGNQQWTVDVRTGMNRPRKGARKQKVLIHRPRIDDWGFTLDLEVDDSLIPSITDKTVRELFDTAGREHGLGTFRPGLFRRQRAHAEQEREKGIKVYAPGYFGRFMVADWEVMPNRQR